MRRDSTSSFQLDHKRRVSPKDKNAAALLKLAWHDDKKQVQEILRAEAERYMSELKKAGIG